MITKTMLCESVIKEYLHYQNQNAVADKDVYRSSRLGVAMEYLGLIKDANARDYVRSRDGHTDVPYFTHHKRESGAGVISTLTFRELLNLLPDVLPEGHYDGPDAA